jgi:hypothetical protein
MASTVFYSWQSDLPNSTNRGFIQRALERAAKDIISDESILVEPVVDRDTSGVPGSPDIATTILEKIDACDVFVCDVSIINHDSENRLTPNPNVLIELGYALKRLGWNRVIMIFNTQFGKVEDLPFDLRMKRVISYSAIQENQDKASERRKLQKQLTNALKVIYTHLDKEKGQEQDFMQLPTAQDRIWLEKMRHLAMEDYSKSRFTAYVEAFSTLSAPRVNQSQNKLLKAVRVSEIRTFGWPIGVMDINTDHMRPKPLSDGIVNSILAADGKSFDFWALRNDGSFYLLKSLFEDMQTKNLIYFDTRIVRTTEMLLFLSKLYGKLSVPKDCTMSFQLWHSGLNGRYISATSSRSLLRPHGPARENSIDTQIVTTLNSINTGISELVFILLSPVFVLFDFFEIERRIHDEIVNNFVNGKIE